MKLSLNIPKMALYGLFATAIAIPFSQASAQPYSANQKASATTTTTKVDMQEATIDIKKFQRGETLTDAQKDNAIRGLLQMVTWFADGDITPKDIQASTVKP